MDSVTIIKIASFLSAAICMGFGAIGSAIGEGLAAGYSVHSLARQPKQSGALVRHMLIGQAVAETTGIFALVLAMIFIFSIPVDLAEEYTVYGMAAMSVGFIGGAFAMGLGALGTGVGNGMNTASANDVISIVPARHNRVLITMFIGQALAQTPAIFGLLIALFLKFGIGSNFSEITTTGDAVIQGAKLLGAGLAMGAGSFGPALGISTVGMAAAVGTGRHVENRPLILRTLFIGAAVTESTSIYSFVIALLLLFK